MSKTLALAQELIRRPSITPKDGGCQQLIAQRLAAIGFTPHHLRFGEVENLWSRRGNTQPLLALVGHTDVVPPGALEKWQFPPFSPTLYQGFLYGRGSADMKGSVAAMVVACEHFVTQHPQYQGSIALLLTSDEEGIAIDGTRKVMDYLQQQGETIDWALVGEPSSVERIGDVVKNGRRGSLTGRLTLQGVQGHVAYPQLADNPIHRCLPVLQALCQQHWDNGNDFFPPTSFQIADIHAGNGTDNVIPGELEIIFNFRYSTELSHTQLQEQVSALLDAYGVHYHLSWRHSGAPFLTAEGELVTATRQAVSELCGYRPMLSTAGGTSDGRFIAPTGAQVIELGPSNATIHKVNECAKVADLEQLTLIYQRILEKLLL